MVHATSVKSVIRKSLLYAASILVAVLAVIPFVWMLKTSFQTLREINAFPPVIVPERITLESYVNGLTGYLPFGRFFLNTFIVTGTILVGHMFASSLVAYPFARLQFPGRRVLFFVMLSTMMLPHSVTLVPLYVIYARLGWINTFLPLVVPAFLGWPFFIFLMRQFMMGIPADLSDSARIDGLNEPGIWARIIVPLCKPALVAIALLSVISSWGDFMRPLLYLRNQSRYTVALGLQLLSGLDVVRWNDIMAVSVLTTLPPMILFLVFQRYFVQGVTFSGTKL